MDKEHVSVPEGLEGVDLETVFDTGDYYKPPAPTKQTVKLESGRQVTINLVGHNVMEAHRLWNGGRFLPDYLEAHASEIKDRTVLEIGAAAGLPSLVCAMLGARKVVVTDYPSEELMAVLRQNVAESKTDIPDADERIVADGFAWGGDVEPLLAHLAPEDRARKFDVLILADLLFRHEQHANMVRTLQDALGRRRGSRAYVFFTSYRPWLRHKDLAFFDLAMQAGFVVEQVLERQLERPMFENDPGEREVLTLLTGWTIRWPEESCVSSV